MKIQEEKDTKCCGKMPKKPVFRLLGLIWSKSYAKIICGFLGYGR